MNFQSDRKFKNELWEWQGCCKSDTQSHLMYCIKYKDLRHAKYLSYDKDLVGYFEIIIQKRCLCDWTRNKILKLGRKFHKILWLWYPVIFIILLTLLTEHRLVKAINVMSTNRSKVSTEASTATAVNKHGYAISSGYSFEAV